MRTPIMFALLLAAGCRDDKGAVLLHATHAMSVSPPLSTYSSSTAAAVFFPDGPVQLTATSNEGVLGIRLHGPLTRGTSLELSTAPSVVQFDVDAASWANQGGIIVVESVDPLIVRLVAVPMSPRNDFASGNFSFDGEGTFR
ncbi:MAG TPA: hypothetical protein VK771_06030 [Acidimicrobiia bacterium]|jgi:hypothetical protein|nr:hypothetical protein [Acidimicrobiia bacterium]